MMSVWFVQWRTEQALELVMRTQQDVLRRSQLQSQQMLRDNAARAEQRQAELQRQESLRLQALTEKSRAEEAARRAALDAADRKAKAWAKFYRKPAVCEDTWTMDCANGYIRAKQAFEAKFIRGEL